MSAEVERAGRLKTVVATAVAAVAFLLSLLSWGLSSPLGSSPDDDYHMASIWCGQGFRDGVCEQGAKPAGVVVPAAVFATSICYAFDSEKSGACDATLELRESGHSNADKGYPPVFYWVMSQFVGTDIYASVLAMRAFNSVMLVGLVALTVLWASPRFRYVPLVAMAVTVMPLGIFLAASVNPSSWAYISVLVFIPAFASFLVETSRENLWKNGSLALVAVLIGAGARADVAAFLVIATVVTWISVGLVHLWKFKAAFSGVVVAVSVAFYLNSQQNDFLTKTADSSQDVLGNLAANIVNLPLLLTGVFGTWGLGWLDTEMPSSVWFLALASFVGVAFTATIGLSKYRALASGLVAAALILLPLYVLTRQNIPVGVDVQPRYLLPLVAVLVAVLVFPSRTGTPFTMSRFGWLFVGAGLIVANAVALHVNIRRYVTGTDVQGVNLDTAAEWWWEGLPITPNGVWLMGSVSMAVAIYCVWVARNELRLTVTTNERWSEPLLNR